MSVSPKEQLKWFLQKQGVGNGSPFPIEEFLFDKQREFVLEPHRFKTACCGGRAGKTVSDAAYLIKAARERERCVALYITLSRSNAKKLIWPELHNIDRKYNLGGKFNESDLSVRYGDSFIYASGASSRDEIEKFRGLPLYLCIIDEIQSFPSYIEPLIDDVVSKRLFDFGGTLALTGTPGPVPVGYFYETCHSPAYKHFAWTMFDNPWIKTKSGKEPSILLEEELARKGVTADHPSVQREVFGRWVHDTTNLVLCYDPYKNHYEDLPKVKFDYIMGIDLGYQDADAIAVLAHSDRSPITYLVDERITTKQGLTELFRQVEELRFLYQPYKIVVDCGGLGKKIEEEMRRRYKMPVHAAEKSRKFENYELFNDAMRTQRFMAKKTSQFAKDAMLLEWDVDKMRPDKKVVSDRFHSDIVDATLYAFRESPAYTYKPVTEKPKWGTPEWGKQESINMERQAEDHFLQREMTEKEQVGDIEWI